MRKYLSVVLVVIVLCSVVCTPLGISADNTTTSDINNAIEQAVNENGYDIYMVSKGEVTYLPQKSIVPFSGDFPIELKKDKVFEFTVNVEYSGWYELLLTYKSLSSSQLAFSFFIDGEIPYTEAEKFIFPSMWKNKGNLRYDNKGNQVSPEQVISTEYIGVYAREYTGVEEKPYRFYLAAGEHNVSISTLYGNSELKTAEFVSISNLPTYEEYIDKNKNADFKGDPIVIEGEDAVLKNSRSLIALSDKRDSGMSPADAIKGKLNYIGGSNWENPGDMIAWEIEVKESGYYKLGMRYRQSEVVGSPSYRELKIDGVIPFQEAGKLKFTYGSDWKYEEFGEEEPYLFYLEEGFHTITLSVTGGDMISVYKKLKDITGSLGELYVDITMIVGETVDVQRSYELFKQIPNFNKRLKMNIEALNELAEYIEELQESTSGTTVSIIDSAIQTLTMMLEKPYSAHKYKSSFYNSYTNLSAQMGSMLNMPLDLDSICFIPEKSEYNAKKSSFWKDFSFSVKRFISSFVTNYQVDSNDNDDLTIWVNWGRDQAQAISNVILNDFEPEHNISVDVKVVNATLIQAILSGKGPDIMLQMQRSEPVDLAMRGGLIDLSQFDGFDKTVELFREGATIPYQYQGGTYALPDTQSFYMMFARTDILSELEIEIPETWEDYITVLTLLQRSNLQVCLPQSLSATMLVQNNLSYYNKELNATALADSQNISVLKEYFDFFTQYKVPITMDFYNRFRIGSAPLGIANYTLGTQLQAAAPEIDGCWEMYPLPGTVEESGNINFKSAGEGTGCGITKLSNNKESAWEFLKWWVSKDTQLAYSNELETVLGPLGRVAVSNKEALAEMSWEPEMLVQINKQWSQVEEMPQIAGSYYVDRSITQIFWNVTEMNANAKDTIIKWAAIADSEISRKQYEYADR